MNDYNQFVDVLKADLETFLSSPKKKWHEKAISYVNGFAADELRRLIIIEIRRYYGAFFTGNLLAKKVLESFKPSFTKDSYIYDPACGAGDLLIAVSDYFKDLNIDLKWQSHLLGTDLHKEFVEATRLRLITKHLLRNQSTRISKKQVHDYRASIIAADGLLNNSLYKKATHIFVNPPFNQIRTDEKLSWSNGKVSAAALFIDKIIQNINPGVTIIAILPDVLRSGSRYEKWRNMVQQECVLEGTMLLGQFDKFADVDVYAICLTKRKKPKVPKLNTKSVDIKKQVNNESLESLFDICVGPVVDNRDLKEGPSYPYVVSRGLEGWSIQNDISVTRKHQGKTFEGPFIVIKRTSRMSDSNRAVATIINLQTPAFVDNHLIVLKPKSGKLSDCRKGLEVLKDNRTNQFLNSEIRCRHLTVKVVSKIPIW